MMRAIQMAVASVAVLVATAGSDQVQAGIIMGGGGLSSPDQTIDFSEVALPNGNLVTTQFSSFGIEFSGGFFVYSGGGIVDPPPTGTKPQLNNFPFEQTSSFNTNLSIYFTQDATDFATSFASNGNTFTFASFLDGNPVESFNFNGSIWQKYGFQNSLFDEVRITAPTAMVLDDIQFNNASVAAVPEPSTLAAFGLCACVAGVGAARRCRREERQAAAV